MEIGRHAKRRDERRDQVCNPTGYIIYGPEFVDGLLESARLLLLKAREDGAASGDGRKNRLTLYGPSAIVVAHAALESFLNEVLKSCLCVVPDPTGAFKKLVERDRFMAKFTDIPALVTGGQKLVNDDLELVHEVRHEIVHCYPHHVGTSTNVPNSLTALIAKDILVKDISWHQKLQSFELARWSFRTIADAATQFCRVLAQNQRTQTYGNYANLFTKLVRPPL
jgi:hypothetical protein